MPWLSQPTHRNRSGMRRNSGCVRPEHMILTAPFARMAVGHRHGKAVNVLFQNRCVEHAASGSLFGAYY